MKPYFTKWIPVEGEIKVGDYVKCNGGEGIVTSIGSLEKGASTEVLEEDGEEHAWRNDVPKKHKLFLCSRDIKVGDTVKWFGKYTYGYLQDIFISDEKNLKIFKEDSKEPYGKVIGEVSPQAIWVKEGMEFDEDEIDDHPVCEQCQDDPSAFDCHCHYGKYKVVPPIFIKFKCPCCGTFH